MNATPNILKSPMNPALATALSAGASALTFLILGSIFLLLLKRSPFELWPEMAKGSFGDWYSLSETLTRAAPILLCALAVAIPARMGLLSVGAEGQFYAGAWLGTGFVLGLGDNSGWISLIAMLLFGCLGGAIWAAGPGFLRARFGVNETLSTLVLNYVSALLVSFVVYGAWKDPNNMGWPATKEFAEGLRLPTYFDSRLHAGLWIGIILAIGFHIMLSRSRWGLSLRILKSNPRMSLPAGIGYQAQVVITLAIGGALAGLAGICEVAGIHGRLQSGIALDFGLSGFVVAWLARQNCIAIIPLAIIMGGLSSMSDALQLFAELPKSISTVFQAILFISVLLVDGIRRRRVQ
jgi:simple sugar transport system permease protein